MGFVERDFGRATDFSKDSGVFQNCTLVLNESNTVALVELLMELRNKKSTLWIDWGGCFQGMPKHASSRRFRKSGLGNLSRDVYSVSTFKEELNISSVGGFRNSLIQIDACY